MYRQRNPLAKCRPEQRSLYWTECMLHAQLRHSHIVQFLGYYIRSEGRYLVQVTELPSSTLGECIDRNGVLPNEISHSILHHVALGLRYLHERLKPIIHRDLTANHVYLMDDMTAKIGDFASAKVLTPETSNVCCLYLVCLITCLLKHFHHLQILMYNTTQNLMSFHMVF